MAGGFRCCGAAQLMQSQLMAISRRLPSSIHHPHLQQADRHVKEEKRRELDNEVRMTMSEEEKEE